MKKEEIEKKILKAVENAYRKGLKDGRSLENISPYLLTSQVTACELSKDIIQALTEPTQEGVVSAEEVEYIENMAIDMYHDLKNLYQSIPNSFDWKNGFKEGAKWMHTYASQTREEEMKKHAVGFHKWLVNSHYLYYDGKYSKPNEAGFDFYSMEQLYNEYLEQK